MSLEGKASPGQVLKGGINAIDVLTISAYGIAVKHGFEGTEEEWLDALSPSDEEIKQAVYEYINDNPVGIDKTLTVSGEAADAKVTGDAFKAADEAIEAAVAAADAANKEAKADAAEAMSAAGNAQATADIAVSDAANAQNTADTAVVNAAAAQKTADEGKAAAATAQETADAGVEAAGNAQTTADEAKNALGGCWIEFTDEDGNPTDEPYIHWMQEV
jgi:hypothetical protein